MSVWAALIGLMRVPREMDEDQLERRLYRVSGDGGVTSAAPVPPVQLAFRALPPVTCDCICHARVCSRCHR